MQSVLSSTTQGLHVSGVMWQFGSSETEGRQMLILSEKSPQTQDFYFCKGNGSACNQVA
jgi:hypothetical protein